MKTPGPRRLTPGPRLLLACARAASLAAAAHTRLRLRVPRRRLTDTELGPWLGQPPSALQPGDAGMVGHCGVTPEAASTARDCERARAGSWPLRQIGAHTLDECAAHCRAHCPRCRFVSFSTHPWHRDCSWYADCGQLELNNAGHTYRTRLVRPEALLAQRGGSSSRSRGSVAV